MKSLAPPGVLLQADPGRALRTVAKLEHLLGQRHSSDEVVHTDIIWQGLVAVPEVGHVESKVFEPVGIADLGVELAVGLDRAKGSGGCVRVRTQDTDGGARRGEGEEEEEAEMVRGHFGREDVEAAERDVGIWGVGVL